MIVKLRKLFSSLAQAPRLSRHDWWLTLLPVVLWWGATQLRPVVIETYCKEQPVLCADETIPAVDRPSVHLEYPDANRWSFYTQDGTAVAVGVVPVLFHGARMALGRVNWIVGLSQLGTDLLIYGQTALWNGVFMDAARTFFGRPRPFVYKEPVNLGANHAHYTSFYSGHTSFVACAVTCLLILLLGRGVGRFPLWMVGGLGMLSIFSTGLLRIFAGRHFTSDVLVAVLAGILVALAVAWIHRQSLVRFPK